MQRKTWVHREQSNNTPLNPCPPLAVCGSAAQPRQKRGWRVAAVTAHSHPTTHAKVVCALPFPGNSRGAAGSAGDGTTPVPCLRCCPSAMHGWTKGRPCLSSVDLPRSESAVERADEASADPPKKARKRGQTPGQMRPSSLSSWRAAVLGGLGMTAGPQQETARSTLIGRMLR